MANVLVDENSLKDIADAIRTKNGTQTKYKPSQMADAIEAISGGGIIPSGTIQITSNGTVDVANYASAEVNVPTSGTTPTGTKQISITENGTTTEDVTNYASAEITVNVPTSGGSGVESGTFTGDETKTIAINISSQPSYVLITSPHSDFGEDNTWNTLELLYCSGNSNYFAVQRYGTSNVGVNDISVAGVSYENGVFTINNLRYGTRSGKTYYWFAW